MLRRLIVPIVVIVVLAVMGSMCTAVTGAKARRRLQHRELPPTANTTPLAIDTDSAQRQARAASVACPKTLPDTTGWKRVAPEGSPISIQIPPDFAVVPATGSPESNPPFLVVRAMNGDEYRLTNSIRDIRASDFRDYHSTSTCRIMIGYLYADLETASDTWRGGDHNVVLASYFLGTMHFITLIGTTESVEHQRQLVAMMHYARFTTQ
jgi:hypothetical protein